VPIAYQSGRSVSPSVAVPTVIIIVSVAAKRRRYNLEAIEGTSDLIGLLPEFSKSFGINKKYHKSGILSSVYAWNTKVYPLSFSERAPARVSLLSNHPFASLSLRGSTPRALNQTKSPDGTGHFVWQPLVDVLRNFRTVLNNVNDSVAITLVEAYD
jgi:hypothetical protein